MIRIWNQQGIFITVAFVCSAVLLGCNGDSAEGIVRNVGLVVEGFYVHSNPDSFLVERTSGAPVRSLNLRQSGDQLEGVDNNGILFKGTVGQVFDETRASFNLEGRSTSGEPASIAGTIDVEVGGTTATMRGTWIEPTLASTVFGVATVPTNAPPAEPTPGTNATAVAVMPTSVIIVETNSQQFTASGGSGVFIWSRSIPNIGNFTDFDGDRNERATYTANGEGSNTITVVDANGSRPASPAVVIQTPLT